MKGRMVLAAAPIRKLHVVGSSRRHAGFRRWKSPVSAEMHRGCNRVTYDFAPGRSNHLYSIAAITDSTGAVRERYRYNAYGVQTVMTSTSIPVLKSRIGQDRGFTGYKLDSETGLYFARARMYSAKLGRFVNRDPAGYIDGAALYHSYFTPNLVDPTGAQALKVEVGGFINGADGAAYSGIRTFGVAGWFSFAGSVLDLSRAPSATPGFITGSSYIMSPSPLDWADSLVDGMGGFWVWDMTPWYYRTDSRGPFQQGTSRGKWIVNFDTNDVGNMAGKASVTFRNDPTFAVRNYDLVGSSDLVVAIEGKANFGSNPSVNDVSKNCKTIIKDKVSGGDPLAFGAPKMDMDFTLTIDKANSGAPVEVKLEFTHDSFPDYEVMLNGTGKYSHRGTNLGGLLYSNGTKTIPLGSY